MLPKKRKLWNQVEILLEMKKLSFDTEQEMIDFFNKCFLIIQETGCQADEAIDNLKNEYIKNNSPTIIVPDNFVEELNEEEIISSTTDHVIIKKGRKKNESK